ncbi:uncharacterized protein BKCO1_2000271 [Diplodia corticola]|uniref:Duf3433 domain protein n=1 Tax=Diplodia corticola TaxID=236234 RepID=A0A1J9REQ2_9PEZI|nr:uncharacterized protein BKCO1_2000271 [Diplodia corticola]OJD39998.1 hypothetical protein BKCO1_2000271 [Diplodia corticola]
MDDVPASLRAGSPATEGYNPFSDRNSIHRETPSPHLVSPTSEYPQRPSLVSTRRDSRQRYSYASSISSPDKASFAVSDVPSPPAFPASTAYDSAPASFTQSSPVPSRQPSLFSKLGSLKAFRGSRRSRYGRLEDDDEGGSIDLGKARLMDVEEERDDDGIAFDISAFEGPIPLRKVSVGEVSGKSDQEMRGAYTGLGGASQKQNIDRKPTKLGSGMHGVLDASEPVRQATIKRGKTSAKEQRKEAQRAAEKFGEILAVETPAVDLSSYDGADYERRSIIERVATAPKGRSETSYYFPPDPDMPSWRPMSMRWWWITMLIVIAMGLGVVQELLCQVSIRKGQTDGLLKFHSPQEISLTAYFTWKYAPTIILLSYGILWQISDFEVKRLEPYYQLSRPGGASASASLNMDYLTFLSYLIPLRAARHRQWAVLFSSLATLISGSLVPVLQSASVKMYPEKDDRSEVDEKFIRIVPVWSRIMSASLFAVAFCGMLLMFKLQRKSGLLSDPKGIAGIAAMATQSHILQDFQGLDIVPTHVIHKQLAHRRYLLHKSSLWQGEYIRNTRTEEVTEKFENPHPLMLTLKGGIPYICGIIVVMVLLPVFLFQPEANIVTEKIPFLLTAIGTIIKLLWGTLEMDVRIVEPFYILSRRNAPPRTLTLDYTGTMPGYLPVQAFFNRHYLVSAVGIGAVMTEVLTVCMSSFSVDGKKFISGEGHDNIPHDEDNDSRYNTDETFKSFWVSFALALGILVYLCVVASIVYAKRRHYFLPRQPGSIASVLAFIHQSNMLVKFVDTQRLDSKAMTRYLEEKKGTYALGWFRGRDGEDHCGIDEEPIAAEYKHGVDWRKGRVTGVSSWEVY